MVVPASGIDLDATPVDEQLVTETVAALFTEGHFDISVDPDTPDDDRVFCNYENISEAIRSSEISAHVSVVSSVIPVRHVLIAAQRAYIAEESTELGFSEAVASSSKAVTSPMWWRRTPRCASC